jgi:hypothetical protein
MAIPNYTYLKLKMPGPKRVITISSSYEHTYECDIECIEYGEAVESSTKLASKLEALAVKAPDPKHHTGSFELAEGTKKIPPDPNGSDDNVLTISATSTPNRKPCSSTFSVQTPTCLHGVPQTCLAFQGKSPSTPWRFEPVPSK